MSEKKTPMVERVPFVAALTLLGGFLDAYTYITRGGVFANNHTGNVAKLGIMLAQGNLSKALDCFIPMLACFLGVILSEVVRSHTAPGRDWQKTALAVEAAALAAASFLPMAVPDAIVTTLFSLITGFQFTAFRKTPWGAHNTTISTGNLRTLALYTYEALTQPSPDSRSKWKGYALIAASFPIGAGLGVPLCLLAGNYASLAGALLCAVLLAALCREKKAV